MENIFIGIYHFFEKRRLVFYSTFILSFLGVAYFAMQVKFEEDISKILPKDKRTENRISK